jgi:alpha-mannosidase
MSRYPLKKVFVVFKTHFDIGYTHLAKELLQWYSDGMIKDALTVCQATKGYPAGKRYVWTLPSWPMQKTVEGMSDEYLKQSVEHLLKEGQLIWHAFPYTTYTEFCGLEELIRGLYVSRELAIRYGRWPQDAKMTDVPGHTWILPTILAKAGVQFLHLGSNEAATPPDVPRLFFWEGPDGSRVLTYYSKGSYGTDLVPPEDWEYPYWLAMLHTLDNQGPQNTAYIEALFARAERELSGVEVVIGALEDFGKAMLEGDFDIPVVRGDMADTWIRGVGSAPTGVRKVRTQRSYLSALESAASFKKLYGVEQVGQHDQKDRSWIAKSYEKTLLFGEHTWGMDTKITILPDRRYGAPWDGREYQKEKFEHLKKHDPGYKKLIESWEEQLDYLRDTDIYLGHLKQSTLDTLAGAVDLDGERMIVMNALGWSITAPVNLDGIDLDQAILIDGETGEGIEMYLDPNEQKVAAVKDIPALGYRTVTIKRNETPKEPIPTNHTRNIAYLKNLAGGVIGIIDTPSFRIEVDEKTGCLKRLYQKSTDKEWVNQTSPVHFGQYLYDIYSNAELEQYLCDYACVLRDWVLNDYGKPGYPADQQHEQFSPRNFMLAVENGHNWGSILVTARIEDDSIRKYGNAQEIAFRITGYADQDYLDLQYDLKEKIETPLIESGYFTFPIALDNPKFRINKIGSVIDPTCDILPGCNKDLYCCENWVDISDGTQGMAIIPLDMPLFSLSEPGVLKFDQDNDPKVPDFLFLAFTNAWGTNFPQWIGGDLSFRYRLLCHQGDWKEGQVWKTAYETVQKPIVGYAKGKTGTSNVKPVLDILKEDLHGCKVLAFKVAEEGDGYILRIHEVQGKPGKVTLKFNLDLQSAYLCDLVERKQAQLTIIREDHASCLEIDTEPFEIHTMYLEFGRET